jgi:hypothetical protein
MRIDSSGNVGIGTNNPSVKLQVAGQVIGGGGTGAQFLGSNVSYSGSNVYFATQGDAAQRIHIGHYDSSTLSFPTGLVASQVLAAVSNLELASRDISTGSVIFRTGTGVPERMRIDSAGNVVVGNTGDFTISKVMAQGDFGVIRSTNGTTASPVTDKALSYVMGNNQVYSNISFVNSLTTDSSTWITFNTTASGSTTPVQRMIISSGGLVGIGTNTPSNNLQVNGGITATAIAATTASITSTLASGGLNIVFSGTFNNTGVANAIGGYNNSAGIIYINGTGGITSIPFWSNAGAGVAWQFQWIIPGSSAIQSPSGTSTFTLGGTGGSTFTLTFTGANGQVTLTRTAGSGSFTAYVQLLGS